MFRKKLSVMLLTVAALGIFQVSVQAHDDASITGGGGNTGDVVILSEIQPKDGYTVNAGGSKGGDVPVTPGLQAQAGDSGAGKGGDIPVTPG